MDINYYEDLLTNKEALFNKKQKGQYYTPNSVTNLLTRLLIQGIEDYKDFKVYDPCCGVGNLLLLCARSLKLQEVYGQDIEKESVDVATEILSKEFKTDIQLGDVLCDPKHKDLEFELIIANPPYSVKWIGNDDPTLINDYRFAPAGVLAPKSKADFAFVLHILHYLSPKGRASIVCFPGIFYRGGAEQKIRQYLVDNNYVETVISLAPNLFFGTSVAVTILVLAKNKTSTDIQFIDASGEEFFKKEKDNNVMYDEHIDKIIDMFGSKEDVEHVAKTVKKELVKENDYNLSVSSYVEAKDTREVIDIVKLNAEIKETAAKIDRLKIDIDTIIGEIEPF